MNLIKFPLVTSDDFVANSAIVLDADKLVESVCTGATLVCTFAGASDSILTFTFDGANSAVKLQSATAMQTLLMNDIQTLCGPNGVSRGVFEFVPEAKTAAGKVAFEARAGLVIDGTATAGTGLVSIALT
jgi:hypothetical protein